MFLDSFGMGAGHKKNQEIIRSFELLATSFYPPQRGEGMEMELEIHHAYVIVSIKISKVTYDQNYSTQQDYPLKLKES